MSACCGWATAAKGPGPGAWSSAACSGCCPRRRGPTHAGEDTCAITICHLTHAPLRAPRRVAAVRWPAFHREVGGGPRPDHIVIELRRHGGKTHRLGPRRCATTCRRSAEQVRPARPHRCPARQHAGACTPCARRGRARACFLALISVHRSSPRCGTHGVRRRRARELPLHHRHRRRRPLPGRAPASAERTAERIIVELREKIAPPIQEGRRHLDRPRHQRPRQTPPGLARKGPLRSLRAARGRRPCWPTSRATAPRAVIARGLRQAPPMTGRRRACGTRAGCPEASTARCARDG